MTTDPHRNGLVHTAGVPLERATAAIVLLHGRGASAEDILGLGPDLVAASARHQVAFLAPQAADRTWYPSSFLAPLSQNEPWRSSALAKIAAVVDQALAVGLGREKIAIAGFSQGACLATEFLASHPAHYGGLIAFTGGLMGPPGAPLVWEGDLAGTPVLLASGDPDPHVPWARVEQSAAILGEMGAAVSLQRYPGLPHTIIDEEIELARQLLAGLAEPPIALDPPR